MFIWLRGGIRCFVYMLSLYDIHVKFIWHTLKHICWDRHSLTKTYKFHHLPGSVWTKSRLRSLSWNTTCLRYQITEFSFEKGFISYVYWNINRVINQTIEPFVIYFEKNTCKISASPFVCVPFEVQFSVSHFSTMLSQTMLWNLHCEWPFRVQLIYIRYFTMRTSYEGFYMPHFYKRKCDDIKPISSLMLHDVTHICVS